MAIDLDDLDKFHKKLPRLTHANLLRELNEYEKKVGDLEDEISRMSEKAFDKERPKLVMQKDTLQQKIFALSEEIKRRKTQLS